MKRIVVMILFLIMAMTGIVYAESETETPDPIIEQYNFSQTQEEIRELLGNPDDSPKQMLDNFRLDEYFDIEYSGISGHLGFTYVDGLLDIIAWESPEDLTEADCDKLLAEISAYYDQEYGTESEVKESIIGDRMDTYRWKDEFNKRKIEICVFRDEDHLQVGISKSKIKKIDLDIDEDEMLDLLNGLLDN